MSANVLLILSNELGKDIKCEASFYLFFCNEFNKLNNARARMLDSIKQKNADVSKKTGICTQTISVQT